MTISRQNLTIIIVAFKSEKIIHQCLKSLPDEIQILIIDNSTDKAFKEKIEKIYKNVKCILAPKNLGMGAGNNLGLRNINTDYALILNPDVTLENNTIDEIIIASKKLVSFALLAPISSNKKYPNYRLYPNQESDFEDLKPFKVVSIDGYAMVLNFKRLNKLKQFYDAKYFDENFFMYLENDDLCKRLLELNENIYIIPKSKIHHFGGKAVDARYEYQIEMSRNWHWLWSKFYFQKKHFGFFSALIDGLPSFISALFKFIFYFFINKRKKDIYFHRMSGYMNALIGNASYFRPKINDQES